MLDESSPNGPCRGSPCSALGWEMGISAIRVEGGTYLCPKALGPPHPEEPSNPPIPRVAPCMAVHLTLTQPGDFFLVPKTSEQTVMLPWAPTSNKI